MKELHQGIRSPRFLSFFFFKSSFSTGMPVGSRSPTRRHPGPPTKLLIWHGASPAQPEPPRTVLAASADWECGKTARAKPRTSQCGTGTGRRTGTETGTKTGRARPSRPLTSPAAPRQPHQSACGRSRPPAGRG